jgi:hypothetical protein
MIGGRKGWGLITSETSIEDRHAIVKAFQAGELLGVAGTIGAMGVGLTMTKGSNILRIGRDWTPAMNWQAEDRALRHGQTAEFVLINDLVADHVLDVRLTFLLLEKEETLEQSTLAAAVRPDEYVDVLPVIQTHLPELPEVFDVPEPFVKEDAPWRTMPNGNRVQVGPNGNVSNFRAAETEVEVWAAAGLVLLAGMDADRARVQNGAGFGKFDGELGHSIADRIVTTGMLSVRQWEVCVRMARKYRRQLPPEPNA